MGKERLRKVKEAERMCAEEGSWKGEWNRKSPLYIFWQWKEHRVSSAATITLRHFLGPTVRAHSGRGSLRGACFKTHTGRDPDWALDGDWKCWVIPHPRFLVQHMLCKRLGNCFRAFGSQKGHDEQMVLANMFYLLGSSCISIRDAARFVGARSVVDGCLQKELLGSPRSKPAAKSTTVVGLIFVIFQEFSVPRVFLWPLGLLKGALRLLSISQF